MRSTDQPAHGSPSRNPGLKPRLDDTLAEAYELAVASTMDETGLPRSSFPEHCPYGFGES